MLWIILFTDTMKGERQECFFISLETKEKICSDILFFLNVKFFLFNIWAPHRLTSQNLPRSHLFFFAITFTRSN
jgi:hypothetical protein